MKRLNKIILLIAVAVLGSLTFTSCEKDLHAGNIPAAITSFLNDNYSGYVIMEAEKSFSFITVEIMHNRIEKDVIFSTSEVWMRTSWDVSVASLPSAVVEAIEKQYPSYYIDDAEYYESTGGTYYWLDLENTTSIDYDVKVSPDGTILESVKDRF